MASRLRPPQRPICVTRPHLCEILHDFAIFWPCLRDAVRLISAASGGGMGRRGWAVLLIVAVLVLLGIGGGAALFELARLVDPVAAALSGAGLPRSGRAALAWGRVPHVTRYSVMPIPPVEAHTAWFDAGPLRIGVEYR